MFYRLFDYDYDNAGRIRETGYVLDIDPNDDEEILEGAAVTLGRAFPDDRLCITVNHDYALICIWYNNFIELSMEHIVEPYIGETIWSREKGLHLSHWNENSK